MYPVNDTLIDKVEIPKKSVAGMKWFENSLKKTIALYLVMNAVIMFFSSDYYIETKSGGLGNTSFIHAVASSGIDESTFNQTLTYIMAEQRKNGAPVLSITISKKGVDNRFYHNQTELDQMRNSELQFNIIEDGDVTVKLIENYYDRSFWESVIQIFSLIFACLVLFFSYFSGSKDSEIYLTGPFKLIFKNMNTSIRNPIDYLSNPYYLKPSLKSIDAFSKLEEEYSTIGSFVLRYSQYLSYSLGSKQANIVVDRLLIKQPKSLTAVLGEVYHAYIVMIQLSQTMCDIDIYDDRMVSFIQKTQEIVQRTTDKFNGASSCLFDGKFVLVWRLNSDNYKSNFITGNRNSSEAAAMCVTSILKIIAKLGRLKRFYRVKKLLGTKAWGHSQDNVAVAAEEEPEAENLANCIVHCGKIYEHIIGGCQKIDVCYLGPDIAYIDRLHNMSILYNVPIMMTETVYNFMADSIKKQCRMIDVIKLKNAEKQMNLYSLDVNPNCDREDTEHQDSEDNIKYDVINEDTSEYRFFHSRIKEKILERLIKGAKNSIYFEDPDIQSLFKKKPEFKRACRKAIDFYTLGAWDMAKNELDTALRYEPEDGACWFLLKYLEMYDFKKPEHWRGYRNINF